jgi:RimJ/RimL family protein N-acetyltransferase
MGAPALVYRRRIDESYCERGVLADGAAVLVRPLRPADAPLLQEGLLQLSQRTRYLRFHGPRGPFSAEELRFLTDLDGEMHFALGAFASLPQRLVGVARFVRCGPSAARAELALVVADALQGKGLGLLLLSLLRDAALERDVTHFEGQMLEENRPMRDLLRKMGGRVGLGSAGVCQIELPLI